MMKNKILLSFVLVCISTFAVGAVSVSAAASGTCGKNITWTLDDNGTFTVNGSGMMDNYDIEDGENPPWYDYRTSIKEIVIADGITNISNDAFYGCCYLENITIPKSVTLIGSGAFGDCRKLEKITLPDTVTSIGREAFMYCGIKSIIIPDGVTYIAPFTFMFSRLSNITLPKKLTTIGDYAFANCSYLSPITIPGTIRYIYPGAFMGHIPNNIYFDGTKEQYESISISYYDNQSLKKAEKIFLKYGITILDKQGKQLSKKAQTKNETIDLSSIIIPTKNILKLYIDKNYTKEYSMNSYITQDLTLYADFIELNKLKISGAATADIGQKGIVESVSFATDKTATDLVATVKYPASIILQEIKSVDFDITQYSYEENGYTFLSLECVYKNGDIPRNTTIKPFELVFDISENAQANDILNIEFVTDETYLADGNNTYDFEETETAQIKVKPIFVKIITIDGADKIDSATQFTATVSPDNATEKSVIWSVDDTSIASISDDGILTPIKSGTVKITATAKDGSGIYGEKSVNVKVYAEIENLVSNIGVWDKAFSPSVREYTIYVPKDATNIKLTATHNGTLKVGSTKYYNDKLKTILLSENEPTVLNFDYSATGYTDSSYKITIEKFEGTKTTVSDDGKNFDIKPVNITVGNTVILALYDNGKFIEMQSRIYDGSDVTFKTDKPYTNAKVMVWESLENMKSVCGTENMK